MVSELWLLKKIASSTDILPGWFMVFNATFDNISFIS